MISELYKNPQPISWYKPTKPTPPVNHYQPPIIATNDGTLFPYQRAARIGITVSQWLDREKIVQELTKDHDFELGDMCWPASEAGFKKYGICKITGITRSYTEFDHNNDWPSTDNPMLLKAQPIREPQHKQDDFICTTNFLTKEKPDYAQE